VCMCWWQCTWVSVQSDTTTHHLLVRISEEHSSPFSLAYITASILILSYRVTSAIKLGILGYSETHRMLFSPAALWDPTYQL
jgi:hypothetical protein